MKNYLNLIPKNSSIYIYGAGVIGKRIFSTIAAERNDINVLAFVDTYKSGEFMGKEVIKASDIEKGEKNSTVLLASADQGTIAEMKGVMDQYGFKVLIPINLEKEIYSKEDRDRLSAIREKLVFGTEAFDLLIQARTSNDYSGVKEYYDKKVMNKKRQYFSGPKIADTDVVLDGGMFDGKEAMIFAEHASKGQVFTFDPWGGKLIDNREKFNSYKNIEIVKKALWSKTGKVFFAANTASGHEAGAFVSPDKDSSMMEPVDACSIDDFVSHRKLRSVDFIKMDIEGSEIEALKGGANTISAFAPKLAICVYHDNAHFFEIPELLLKYRPDYKLGFEHYTDNMNESVMYFFREP